MENEPQSTSSTPTSSTVVIKRTRWYRSAKVLIPLLLIVGAVGFYLLLDNVIMPLYVKSGSVSTVPKVVGMAQNKAVQVIADAGYEPIQYEVRFDDKAPEGTIIRQTPEGGEETKPGRKIYLIISGGKELAVVPDLSGRSLRDAKMLLLKANLNVGNVGYEYSDAAPNGTVFHQTPAPGNKTSTSTKVNITLSQGPLVGRVPVPTLTGLTLSEAVTKLNASKLQLGNVNFTYGITPNQIIDQFPTQGELIVEGSTVDIWVVRETPQPNSPEH